MKRVNACRKLNEFQCVELVSTHTENKPAPNEDYFNRMYGAYFLFRNPY